MTLRWASSASTRRTELPGSAVPLKAGVVSCVRPSPTLPESLAASRASVGALAWVSMVSATKVSALVLPAESVALTRTEPLLPWGTARLGVTLQLPSAATRVLSSSSVTGMRTAMVSPGLAPLPRSVGVASEVRPSPSVPESLAGSSCAAGAPGGWASTVSESDRPFCWSTAVTTVPLASALAGVKLHLPSASMSTVPSVVPPALSTSVSPARPVPARPRPLVGRMRGTAALTGSVSAALVLPATSSCVALSTVPSASGASSAMRQLPSAATRAVPTMPEPWVRVTVAPGSPLPETDWKPLVGAMTGGATVVSTISAMGTTGLSLPAASRVCTVTLREPSARAGMAALLPSGRSAPVSTAQLPSAPASTVKVAVSPLACTTVSRTVLPGSARPAKPGVASRVTPSPATPVSLVASRLPVGAAGEVVSRVKADLAGGLVRPVTPEVKVVVRVQSPSRSRSSPGTSSDVFPEASWPSDRLVPTLRTEPSGSVSSRVIASPGRSPAGNVTTTGTPPPLVRSDALMWESAPWASGNVTRAAAGATLSTVRSNSALGSRPATGLPPASMRAWYA